MADCKNTRNYYTLDGIPLHDPLGRWTLAEGSQIRSVPARRNTEHSIPGVDGVITNLSPTYEPGAISFGIHILKGRSHDEAMEVLDFWNGVLGQRNRLIPLDHTYNGTTKRAEIQIVASTETSQTFMRALTIEVVASIPGVFWRDISPSISRFDANGVSRLDNFSGGTGPINDPIIKLVGPFTSVRLTTSADPNNILLVDQAASASQEIVVDASAWRARIRDKSSSFVASAGSRVAAISSHGTGTMFHLEPTFNYASLGKEYTITASMSGSTSATYGEIYATRSYL